MVHSWVRQYATSWKAVGLSTNEIIIWPVMGIALLFSFISTLFQ
jgi:hypothetical protein